ncbi:MAG TPA: hypothetical protein VKW78_03685 [Terriglobales bacterium]|nr:hypothetical protein [Terriglobales bacterium]
MPRYLLVVLLVLASAALLSAQVAVTPYGYGTQQGPVVPVVVASPPLLYTPIVHLGDASTAPYPVAGTATALAESEGAPAPPPAVVVVAPQQVTPQMAGNQAVEPPFNFGMAQYSTYPTMHQARPDLAEVARKLKEQKESMSAKTFTNSDIQRIQQQWNATPTPQSTAPNGTIQSGAPK